MNTNQNLAHVSDNTEEIGEIAEHTLVICADVPEWQKFDLAAGAKLSEKLFGVTTGGAVLMPMKSMQIQAILIDRVKRTFNTNISLPFGKGAYEAVNADGKTVKQNANAKGIFNMTTAEVADIAWQSFSEMADYHNGIQRTEEGVIQDSNDAIAKDDKTGLYEAPSGRPFRTIGFTGGELYLLVSRTSEASNFFHASYTIKNSKVKSPLDGTFEVSYGTNRNTTMSVMTSAESAEVDAILASLGAPAPNVNVPTGTPAGLPA
jgi:hypothetical protein